jgi:hypothetical protein
VSAWRGRAARMAPVCLLGAGLLGLAISGEPWALLLPLVALAPWALSYLPARVLALLVVALALAVDSPQDRPADGLWEPPLLWLGQLLFARLADTFALRLPVLTGMDLLLLGLLGAVVRERARGAHGARGARCLEAALLLFAGTVLVVGAWGLARGGDPQAGFWQLRQLAVLPVAGLLLHAALGPKDHRRLHRVVLGSAAIKVAFGAWFAWVVCPREGYSPAYVTSHADTVLFGGALALLIAGWVEERSAAARLRLATLGPWIWVGLHLNDRRLAYAGLAVALGAMLFAMRPGRAKRAAVHLALAAVPLLVGYVAVGWTSKAALFKPVQAVRSIGEDLDRSALNRRVENWNLALTIRERPLLGHGAGHPYREVVRGDDLSGAFSLYRHIPHNSVYWMFLAGGLLGFIGLWTVLVVGAFLSARVAHLAQSPIARVQGLFGLAVIGLFTVQAWGDMGTQSWSPVFLLAGALAASGKLAAAMGAWPAAASTTRTAPALGGAIG